MPFSFNIQDFLIWKGIGNVAVCQPWENGLYEDGGGFLKLTTDPKFILENNPSKH